MAKRQLPSPEVLRQLLRYEPDTGKLFWKERGVEWFKDGNGRAKATCERWNKRFAGKEALTAVNQSGHKNGNIFCQSHLAHRVIWAIAYGAWPTNSIDHIDGDPTNNRLHNLRDVPIVDNMRNMKRAANNTSGVAGVNWHTRIGKWAVRIGLGAKGKRLHLGYFENIHDAIAARSKALAQHGYHPNHGRG